MDVTNVKISAGSKVLLEDGTGVDDHGLLSVTGKAVQPFDTTTTYDIQGSPDYRKRGRWMESSVHRHQFKID